MRAALHSSLLVPLLWAAAAAAYASCTCQCSNGTVTPICTDAMEMAPMCPMLNCPAALPPPIAPLIVPGMGMRGTGGTYGNGYGPGTGSGNAGYGTGRPAAGGPGTGPAAGTASRTTPPVPVRPQGAGTPKSE